MSSVSVMRWVVVCAALAIGGKNASAAAIFTETWANPGDSRGWFIGALGGSGTPSYVGGQVNWSLSAQQSNNFLTGFQAQGQSSASGGNFAGNYPAAGITGFAFDFALDSDSLGNAGPPTLRILFTSTVGGFNSYWRHDFGPVALGGGLQRYVVPLEESSWTQYLGNFAFADAIKNIGTVEVDYFRLGNFSAYSQSGRFANFSTIPEPTGIFLAGLGLISGLAAGRDNRRFRAARV